MSLEDFIVNLDQSIVPESSSTAKSGPNMRTATSWSGEVHNAPFYVGGRAAHLDYGNIMIWTKCISADTPAEACSNDHDLGSLAGV
ncbi:MAG: hypothetical protein ABSD59_10130 [Terracidiphilus sp.]